MGLVKDRLTKYGEEVEQQIDNIEEIIEAADKAVEEVKFGCMYITNLIISHEEDDIEKVAKIVSDFAQFCIDTGRLGHMAAILSDKEDEVENG